LNARKPDTTASVLASIAVAQIGRLARDELLALDRVVAKELEEGSQVTKLTGHTATVYCSSTAEE
jgi:hypothetical protein